MTQIYPLVAALGTASVAALFAATPASADHHLPNEADATDDNAAVEPATVVVVMQSMGFEHPVVRAREDGGSVVQDVWTALDEADDTFNVVFLRDVRELWPDLLNDADVISFYTTGDLPMSDEQIDAFTGWIEAGGGFLGVHVATDTYHNEPRYFRMINGTFNGHPWNQNTTITLKVHEPEHPLVWMYADAEPFQEEIYQFKNYDPEACRVLMSLDMEATPDPRRPYHVPVTWVRTQGDGRIFYSSLGHRPDVWQSEAYGHHLTHAVHWLAGRFDIDTTPNPDLHETENALAESAAGGE